MSQAHRKLSKSTEWDYSAEDLVDALCQVGIESGDTVFVHFCGESLGALKDCDTPEEFHESIFKTLRSVVGNEGTILIPTYTFSFCNQEEFEIGKTPTKGGPWSTTEGFLE